MSTVNTVDSGRPALSIDASLLPLNSVRTAADFAACLDQLRVLAGPLSHREIESRSGGRLHRTKIGQVLGGQFPRLDFLAAYLEVCGIPGDTGDAWHRVWTRLASTTRHSSRPANAALELKKERDAALAQVRRLAGELQALRSTTHAADAERDAAVQQAQQAGESSESATKRLRSAEAARDEAQGRVRVLSKEIMVARARITTLDETVEQLREELASAEAKLADLRSQLDNRIPRNGSRRLTRYTQDEAEHLYGSTDKAPPPVIGER